jgi:large subunit ribosomal protein L21e
VWCSAGGYAAGDGAKIMGKSQGLRRKSRAALTKKVREHGKIPLTRLLTEYKEGEKVIIKIDPAIHKGMPHKRFAGQVATVVAKRGKAYVLKIPQTKKVKTIIALPQHIRKHVD